MKVEGQNRWKLGDIRDVVKNESKGRTRVNEIDAAKNSQSQKLKAKPKTWKVVDLGKKR